MHDNDELAALIDRIAARIGGNRVVVHLPQDTHIPERAVLAVPAQHHLAAAAQAAWPARAEGEPPLRPLRLFERPEKIKVIARGAGRAARPVFVAARDPHRDRAPRVPSASPWNGGATARALTRDYFRVEDETGLRFWLYRDGLYDREIAQEEGKVGAAELVRARAVRMTDAALMPRSASPRISRSCAAHRIRRIMCIRPAVLRLPAIGIADHNTLAGVVRAYKELDNSERRPTSQNF